MNTIWLEIAYFDSMMSEIEEAKEYLTDKEMVDYLRDFLPQLA